MQVTAQGLVIPEFRLAQSPENRSHLRSALFMRTPLLLLMTLLGLGTSPIQAQETKQAPIALTDSTLSNGLGVTVLESHSAPLVTVLLAVRAGSTVQGPEDRGLAHVLEHLLFQSYGTDASSFGQDASRLNATYNGSTSHDLVTYYLMLPSEGAGEAVELLARLVTDPNIRDEDVEKSAPIVLSELARDQSIPTERLRREMSAVLWQDAWHRFDIGGDSTSVGQMVLEKVKDHYDRHYIPSNAHLFITGDLGTTTAFALASEHFGDWEPAGEALVGAESDPEPVMTLRLPESQAVLVEDGVYESTVRIAYRGPASESEGAASSVEALVEALEEPDSRFQRDLVLYGPFDRLSVSFQPGNEASEIVFNGTAPIKTSVEGVLKLMSVLDQIDLYAPGDLTTGAPSTDRLRRLDRAITRERAATLAPYLARRWGRRASSWFDEDIATETLDPERFMAAFEFLRPSNRVIGVLGSKTVIRLLSGELGGSS